MRTRECSVFLRGGDEERVMWCDGARAFYSGPESIAENSIR
jgi:hypothetical protein